MNQTSQRATMLRTKMLDCQIRPAGIDSHAILTAFATTPKEKFTPPEQQHLAYSDGNIKIGEGRYIIESAKLAQLLQLAQLNEQDKVLDIGCGLGYSAAIISQLCEQVVAIETDSQCVTFSQKACAKYKNIKIVQSQLAEGEPEQAPYNAIFIQGAIEHLPEKIAGQLDKGGKIIAVKRQGKSGMAGVFELKKSRLVWTPHFSCVLPLLAEFGEEKSFKF